MLPGQPGDTAFNDALAAARAMLPPPIGISRTRPGSVSAARAAYFGSAEWQELAATTRQVHRKILERFCASHGENAKVIYGDRPIAALEIEFLLRIRDRMKDTPHAANNLMKVLRRFFDFSVARKMMPTNLRARFGR